MAFEFRGVLQVPTHPTRSRRRRTLLRGGGVLLGAYLGLWVETVVWGIPDVEAVYHRQVTSEGAKHYPGGAEGVDRDSAYAPCPFYVVVKTRYRYYPDPPVAAGEYLWFFGSVETIRVKPIPLVRGW